MMGVVAVTKGDDNGKLVDDSRLEISDSRSHRRPITLRRCAFYVLG